MKAITVFRKHIIMMTMVISNHIEKGTHIKFYKFMISEAAGVVDNYVVLSVYSERVCLGNSKLGLLLG